jgi:hypothetical protein
MRNISYVTGRKFGGKFISLVSLEVDSNLEVENHDDGV